MSEKTYQEIQEIFSHGCCGTNGYYKTTFNPFFLVTSCVREFFSQCSAFWVGDLVNSYIPKINKEMIKTSDRFYIVNIKVNEDFGKGVFNIQREIYDNEAEKAVYHTVATKRISFIDLPKGDYKFYLIYEKPYEEKPGYFIMLSPTEY